jgi:hypothetical protein
MASSDLETKIFDQLSSLMAAHTADLKVFISSEVKRQVQQCLEDFSKSNSVSPLSSQGEAAGFDALCAWPLPCFICGSNDFANEKVYYDHIKSAYDNRLQTSSRRQCLMRQDNSEHRKLVAGFATQNESWWDAVAAFLLAARKTLTPGAKAVYRHGTGNHVKLQNFLERCRNYNAAGGAPAQ